MLMQQLAQSNPQINQAMTMLQGKSPQEIRQMAENMCRERGTTPEQVMQMLGLK
jgi:predicted RNase H-like HicB family nuclease